MLVAFSRELSWSQSLAGQLAGLFHPGGQLRFVEPVSFMDIEVAGVLDPGFAGGYRAEQPAPPWSSTPYIGEFHLTAFRTPGTVPSITASTRRPICRFQPGMAAR